MKISNFHKIMALLLMLMVSGVGYAHDVEIDGIYYNLNSETKEASVTYKGDDASDEDEYVGTITIPSTITYNETTYNVTSIGESAFWCCENLKSVTIPNCLKRIEDKAFGYNPQCGKNGCGCRVHVLAFSQHGAPRILRNHD